MAFVDKIRRILRSGLVRLAVALALVLAGLSIYEMGGGFERRDSLLQEVQDPAYPITAEDIISSNTTKLAIFSILLDVPEPANGELPDEAYLLRVYPQGVFAVMSWISIPDTEVILFGSSFTCAIFQETILPDRATVLCLDVPCEREGIPTVDCIFQAAARTAQSEYLTYVNADIMLFPDLLACVEHVGQKIDRFMLVGRRRNANMTSIISPEMLQISGVPRSITKKMSRQVFREAVGHDRNGIDYFAFRKRDVPAIPPFLVGRVQWDQWLLLYGIVYPNITTVEVSDVVQAIHINHGGFKASHGRAGTEYNKNLALQVPHPYVRDLKIYHPGTIWLGRLDETDYILVSEAGRDETRVSEVYFSANSSVGPRGQCPKCWLRPNNQTLEVILYRQHTLVQDRRALVLVPVPRGTSVARVADWYCTATSRGIHNILFVTNFPSVARALNTVGLPAYCHTVKDFGEGEADIFHTLADFAFTVLYKGYNVLLITLQDLLLVDANLVLNDDAGTDIQGVPMGEKGLSFFPSYVKSRGRTYRFWNLFLLRLKDRLVNDREAADGDLNKQLSILQDEFGRLVASNDPVNGPQIGQLHYAIFPNIQRKPLSMVLERCLMANQGIIPKWFQRYDSTEDNLATFRETEPIKCLPAKVELQDPHAMMWRC